jgi:hypothetical protein
MAAKGRFGRPEEIAAAVLYLCSPGATLITGVVYRWTAVSRRDELADSAVCQQLSFFQVTTSADERGFK